MNSHKREKQKSKESEYEKSKEASRRKRTISKRSTQELQCCLHGAGSNTTIVEKETASGGKVGVLETTK